MANTTYEGIDQSLFVESEQGGMSYPALQSTVYKPVALTKKQIETADPNNVVKLGNFTYDRPRMALGQDSVDLMESSEIERLGLIAEPFIFGDQESLMFILPDDARFVVLHRPQLFKTKKDDKRQVSYLQKGDKLKEQGCITIAKLFLAVVKDDKLVLDRSGDIQIFTLKLSSNKCDLISRQGSKDFRTIPEMNDAIVKHYEAKKNSWAAHLVSVLIAPVPHNFQSVSTGESSLGVMFSLVGNAKPLPTDAQKQVHKFIQDDDFKALAADPFGLESKQPETEAMPAKAAAAASEPNDFDVPF